MRLACACKLCKFFAEKLSFKRFFFLLKKRRREKEVGTRARGKEIFFKYRIGGFISSQSEKRRGFFREQKICIWLRSVRQSSLKYRVEYIYICIYIWIPLRSDYTREKQSPFIFFYQNFFLKRFNYRKSRMSVRLMNLLLIYLIDSCRQ